MNNDDIEGIAFDLIKGLSVPTIQERLQIKKMNAEELLKWATN